MQTLKKNSLGGLLIAGGVFLIIYANHLMHKITDSKNFVENVTEFFSNNSMWSPLVSFFGGKAQEEISKYNAPVLALLISGIILVLGGLFILLQRKSKP